MTSPQPLNILIVGTGIAGPTLATCLLLTSLPAPQKPHITILERSPELRTAGQNIDIRGAGVHIIRQLGLEPTIRRHVTGEEGVQHVDERNRVWGEIAAPRGQGSENIRAPTADIEILRGRLARICFDRSQVVSRQVQEQGGKDIEYIFGDYLDELEQLGDGVRVHFAKSGESRAFDIVVGADGLHSATRRMAWGAEGDSDRLYMTGLHGAFFSIPRGPTDTLWRRWYHAPGRRGIMVRPHEDPDKTTVTMSFVSDHDPRTTEVATRRGGEGSVQAQKELIKEYYSGIGWESDRVLKGMQDTTDFYYNPIAQVKLDKFGKGRVILLGDAGYCASPISGMGTTLALNGAYNLAGSLLRHPSDHEAAFAEYEERMRPIVAKAQKLPPVIPILHPETWWGVWILNLVAWLLTANGISKILFRLVGPKADAVEIEDFGFQRLDDNGKVTGGGK